MTAETPESGTVPAEEPRIQEIQPLRPNSWLKELRKSSAILLSLVAIAVSFWGVNESNQLQRDAALADRLDAFRTALAEAAEAEGQLSTDDISERNVAVARLRLRTLEASSVFGDLDQEDAIDEITVLERVFLAVLLTDISLFDQADEILNATLEVAVDPIERIDVLQAAMVTDLLLERFDLAQERRDEAVGLIEEYNYTNLAELDRYAGLEQAWILRNVQLGRCAEAADALALLEERAREVPGLIDYLIAPLDEQLELCDASSDDSSTTSQPTGTPSATA